jgi:hypothetical protein
MGVAGKMGRNEREAAFCGSYVHVFGREIDF